MQETERRRFVITFQDQYPLDMVDGMLRTDFMGLGKAFGGKEPRVVFLYPFAHVSEVVIKETLDELQAVGELTYIEEHR